MNGEQTASELPDDVIRQIQKIVRETINPPPEPAEEGGAEVIREGNVLRVIVRANIVTGATVTPRLLTLRIDTAEVKRWDLDKIRRFIELLTSILMFFHAAEVTFPNGPSRSFTRPKSPSKPLRRSVAPTAR